MVHHVVLSGREPPPPPGPPPPPPPPPRYGSNDYRGTRLRTSTCSRAVYLQDISPSTSPLVFILTDKPRSHDFSSVYGPGGGGDRDRTPRWDVSGSRGGPPGGNRDRADSRYASGYGPSSHREPFIKPEEAPSRPPWDQGPHRYRDHEHERESSAPEMAPPPSGSFSSSRYSPPERISTSQSGHDG